MKSNKIKKFFLSIRNRVDPEPILTEDQTIAFNIFKLSLYDDDNVRYLNSFETNKRYIITKTFLLDKEVNTFIILQSDNITSNIITIVNHQYKYVINLPQKTYSKMISLFDKKVENDREEMEKEIMCNITKSLDLVLSDLQDRIEQKKLKDPEKKEGCLE